MTGGAGGQYDQGRTRQIARRPSHIRCPEIYWPRWARALRNGALDTRMTPANGRASSRIRKIAPATESAQTPSVATTVTFVGAYRPKLAKMIHSQKTRTTRNATGIGLSVACAANSHRACARLVAVASACDFSARWPSFCGESD